MTKPSSSQALRPRSIAVVLGTRPEIIKMAEIVRLLGPAALIVHTGQHYDDNLSGVFFDQFDLPAPDVRLAIGGVTRGQQIGEAVKGLDAAFGVRPPDAVVVQGDTNTVLAAAIAANAQDLPLVHVEAGLRSYDRSMPEEHNRVTTDHLSDLLLAPTSIARANLIREGISDRRIAVTGNPIVEAVQRLLPDADDSATILKRHGVDSNSYVLATLHRPENVDNREQLESLLRQLASLPLPVILPLHPRTAASIDTFGYAGLLAGLRVVDPVGYREFLALSAGSAFLVSDSGGVQEEVSVYKRPLVVVRRSTERPEVLGTFAEMLPPGGELGSIASTWLEDLEATHQCLARTPSPYGDGTASGNSVRAITELVRR